jgi:hypothetical protein
VTNSEQQAFLHNLAKEMHSIVDGTISSFTRDDGGIEVVLTNDDVDWAADLYYVREDDLGHVVKLRQWSANGGTDKKEFLFYANSTTLAGLMLI